MAVAIQIKNLDKLQKLAEKFPAVAERHVNDAIAKSLMTVYANMVPGTPVDTSRLREDFHVPHVTRFQGWIGTKLPYARRIHDLYPVGTAYKNPSKNKGAFAGFLTYAGNKSQRAINELFSIAIRATLKDISF